MKRSTARRAMALLTGFAAMTAAAQAADLYVRAGTEGGDGTREKPYGELWKAVDKAVRGDVIHVAEGTYNGKGGSGHFVVKIPDLTLVGGYKADFSARHPFQNLTILERAKDFRGDWTGLPQGFIAGKGEHDGLIVDGFVMNGESRNTYQPGGDINLTDSYKGWAIEANKPNIRIRNCIILNPVGEGIEIAWGGKDNEVANCLIVNPFYCGISTRSAQPGGEVTIKNCTIAFCWFYPSKGGGMGVFVGRQGKTIMEDNVFALVQTEKGEAGYGVCNTFGNDETVLRGNVFFMCPGGFYKYMDGNKQSLLVWKPEELKALNNDAESYTLSAAGGNTDADPQFAPDKDFIEKFANYVGSEPGKLTLDAMNEWRRSVGLPLQAEAGSKRKNYGMAYPLKAVIPGLFSKLPGKGAQMDGPFAAYASKTAAAAAPAGEGAAATAAKDYAEVTFDAFKKSPEAKALAGKPVKFKAALGATATTWLLANAPRESYTCVKLLQPGEPDTTRTCVFGHILKGSAADKEWAKLSAKRATYNANGVAFKGTAWYLGNDNYPYPVAVIVDAIEKE